MNINEIKKEIEKEYKYKIELHAHTSPVSGCSEITPAEMAEIYHKKGYDAIVITNHFIYDSRISKESKEDFLKRHLSGYRETLAEAEKYGLLVLLGAELRFTENINDYLLYGADEEVLSVCFDYLDKGLETFRREVKLPNSVFIQAHPQRDGITMVDSSLLDGYETFNMHPNHNARIGLAVRHAMENKVLVKTAGSDFHHKNLGHEAVSAIKTKDLPKDSYELAKILKSGDYALEIGEDAIVLP